MQFLLLFHQHHHRFLDFEYEAICFLNCYKFFQQNSCCSITLTWISPVSPVRVSVCKTETRLRVFLAVLIETGSYLGGNACMLHRPGMWPRGTDDGDADAMATGRLYPDLYVWIYLFHISFACAARICRRAGVCSPIPARTCEEDLALQPSSVISEPACVDVAASDAQQVA